MSRETIFVNLLTFLRVPLIVAWLALALVQEFMSAPVTADGTAFCWASGKFALAWVAGLMMILSGVTDLLDGKLARKWNVVSPLGQMADPLMDKVFYVIAFPAITWLIVHQRDSEPHALLMLAFTILYILRDLWVTFMRSVGTLYGADVSAMWFGKVRTALSFPAAAWIYGYVALHQFIAIGSPWSAGWLYSCYAVEAFMIVLNLMTAVFYSKSYLPYLKKALERK